MKLSKKIRNLITANDLEIGSVLDKISLGKSSYYRYINGISDIRSESFVRLLKELGLDIEKLIAGRINECMGHKINKPSLGEDFELILKNMSRSSKLTIIDTIVADAKKARKPSLQEPLGRLIQYKSHLKAGRVNASGGNRK